MKSNNQLIEQYNQTLKDQTAAYAPEHVRVMDICTHISDTYLELLSVKELELILAGQIIKENYQAASVVKDILTDK